MSAKEGWALCCSKSWCSGLRCRNVAATSGRPRMYGRRNDNYYERKRHGSANNKGASQKRFPKSTWNLKMPLEAGPEKQILVHDPCSPWTLDPGRLRGEA